MLLLMIRLRFWLVGDARFAYLQVGHDTWLLVFRVAKVWTCCRDVYSYLVNCRLTVCFAHLIQRNCGYPQCYFAVGDK